jgi:N-acyl homoserine lactone hydrolase
MNALTAVSRTEPGSTGAVKAVSVISTGTVRIHPEHPYGSRKPLYWWLLTSRKWTPPRPINVYVIEHTCGLVLFDTGQDRASVTDDAYFPGGFTGFLYARLARFDIGEQDTLTVQLATLGYAPSDVDTAVVSHLHQDHIGGLPELTGADLLVSAAEWAELSRPGPELRGFLRSHIQLPGLHWHQISTEPAHDPALAPFTEALDVMGDGSLTLLPTPGHTAGSVSLLVRRGPMPPLLLAGDLTYGAEILQRGQLPGVGVRRQLAESTSKVVALAEQLPGLVVLPAHDPDSRPAAAGQLTPETRGGNIPLSPSRDRHAKIRM